MNDKIKILHLEDNDLDAELVKSQIILEGIDCEVKRVKKKDDFMMCINNYEYELILSDNSLPDFDGLSALRFVREKNKNVPFIFLSGTLAEEIAISSMKFGATDYVLKKNMNKIGMVIKRAIHEYRQQEELDRINTEIRLSEERLRLVNKATQNIIVDIDIINNSFLWSDIASQVLGYSKDELGGFEWWLGKIHLDDREKTQKIIELFSESDAEVFNHEYRFKFKNGRYAFMHDSIYVLRNSEKKPIRLVVAMEDTTKRKEYEEELRNAKEKAEISDRLKSEFLAQMSHEIRTPLNIILSYSEMLVEDLDFSKFPEKKELYEISKDSGKRLIRTIDSILNMSELHLGLYKPILKILDIEKNILFPLFKEYQIIASKKGLQFTLNNTAENLFVYSDEYAVMQIFHNLIDNAIKYTNKGYVEIKISNDFDGKLLVEIFDSGIGMTNEYMLHLYEMFRQEEQGYSRTYEGNGLGLALVKRYCEIINADISVESKKDEGTKFRVKFN